MGDTYQGPNIEWLNHVQPVGLVVSPAVLRELGLDAERQGPNDTAAVSKYVETDRDIRPNALADPWAFVRDVLGWPPSKVAGAPGGPSLSEDLCVRLPEHDTTLAPTWAVLNAGTLPGYQLLVRIEERGVDPDKRGAIGGWEATPQQRFERLLRETGIYAGALITDDELRLVYAPSGESSGWLPFPLRSLTTVAGRPMLGGIKLVLGAFRLFNDGADRRLLALLKASRDAQASVSTALSGQVLGALHELLRGIHASDPTLFEALCRNRPEHVYEGLLTVLMRLVFVLYAEDRDLIPSRSDTTSRALYERGYSLRQLYVKLRDEAAAFPDTMDERYGAWGRMLALFRLIHTGDGEGWIRGRGGKLFDPNTFRFLEGCFADGDKPRVLKISDGTILRIVEGLMTLDGERLSYRTLDVEQIGSVYETVMGFTVEVAAGAVLAIKAGKNNRIPVFVDLQKLAALGGEARLKFLKENAERGSLTDKQKKAIREARSVDGLVEALSSAIDPRGSPHSAPVPKNTPILQPNDERRRSGSHYTPRSLTEPIVRRALEPTFDRLGSDAKPDDILELKVCDPAMGSGAFLVEACRQLARRLVQAWARWPAKRPKIPADEDDELHAKRLIAQRCLYGVDKNPMATDLTRLSLWLATLARDHEFTFLDHALKSGDSLVGLTRSQIGAAHWDTSKPPTLFQSLVKERFEEGLKARSEIRNAPDDVTRAVQEQRHSMAEERLDNLRLVGDAVVAAFFAGTKPREREAGRVALHDAIAAGGDKMSMSLRTARTSLVHGKFVVRPMHWEIEFPEVFARQNPGFDAVVGNPPFLGGKKISGASSGEYLQWLLTIAPGAGGQSDLVAYFFRRSFALLRNGGSFGLIATNTISQGDTRTSGLLQIRREGGDIFSAIRRLKWPGAAAVTVSTVHVFRGPYYGKRTLNGMQVEKITAYLNHLGPDENPVRLRANGGICFKGVMTGGDGFVFRDGKDPDNSLEMMRLLIEQQPASGDRIFPFLGGDDILNDPRHQPSRFVVDFFGVPESSLLNWPALAAHVKRKVTAERAGTRLAKVPWWQHERARPAMRKAIKELQMTLVHPFTSSYLAFALIPSDKIVATPHCIFASQAFSFFCSLQNRVHELWVNMNSSTLEDRLGYRPSDCFDTFPLPKNFASNTALEAIGKACYSHRAALMIARNEGLTDTYNRFHDKTETSADIVQLRDLHAEVDRGVLTAYGWGDLAVQATPVFLDEANEDDHKYQDRLFWPAEIRDEVLGRLLALNAERAQEEHQAGLTGSMHDDGDEDDPEDER